MAGPPPRKPGQSVEEWLSQLLPGGDDDEDEASDGDGPAPEPDTLPAGPVIPRPSLPPEPPSEEDTLPPAPPDPVPTDPEQTQVQLDGGPFELGADEAGPVPSPESLELPGTPWELEGPHDPPPAGPVWEADTDPTPAVWDLPPTAIAAPKPAGRPQPQPWETTQTHPFPLMDDEPSEGPELSDPGPYALAEPTPDPEIEDLEPPRQGDFDEVFPSFPSGPFGRGAGRDEETGALLRETDSGRSLPPEVSDTHAPEELEPVGDDPREPGTQWMEHARPRRGKGAEEKTEIRGFGPFPTQSLDEDDAPTVIVPPPPAPLSQKPTPPPPKVIEAPPTSPLNDPSSHLIAWTSTALGALMFFLVVLVAMGIFALGYVDL